MLDVHLALMLEIQKSNPKLPPPKAQEYASWVLEEAGSRTIDPWVFHAIIHTETRWTARIVVHEKNGSCSIGLGGANVSCRSPDVVRLQNPQENIKWIGAFLVGIRGRCRYNCSGLGWVRAYNGGNRDYVPKFVQPIVERCHSAYGIRTEPIVEPPLRQVSTTVHSPWVCWTEDH